jgi:hypothetical protein
MPYNRGFGEKPFKNRGAMNVLTFDEDANGNVIGLVGPNGGLVGVPYILHQSGIPTGIPSSGTMGANGALSGLTAFPATYSGGIWLYFPAGAVYAGSLAGSYWTVMSSSSAGTVYNNLLTIPGPLTPPASPTPIVAAGPGAYTQTTASNISVFGVKVTGGSIGENGQIFARFQSAVNNNANTKTAAFTLGGTTIGITTQPSGATFPLTVIFINRGSQSVNAYTSNITAPFTQSNAATIQTAINTSIDATFAVTLNLAVASDYSVFEFESIQILPGA